MNKNIKKYSNPDRINNKKEINLFDSNFYNDSFCRTFGLDSKSMNQDEIDNKVIKALENIKTTKQ